MLQRDYFNDKICALVVDCHRNIVDIFKTHHIARILFSQHEGSGILHDDVPMVTWNSDFVEASCQELGKIEIQEDGDLVYTSRDGTFSGYTDGFYGDYFDIGQSLPKIYAAICDIVNAGDIRENERTTIDKL